MIANFVGKARETADARTLTTLNEAISRYQSMGGDVAGLTQGKPFSSLVDNLKTPLSWRGLSHQVMQQGQEFGLVQTLESAGSGKDYRITKFNTYEKESGGTTMALYPPIVNNGIVDSGGMNSSLTNTITFSASMAKNQRAVLVFACETWIEAQSVTDSQGNTWTIDVTTASSATGGISILSSYITKPLSPGDTLTVNWGWSGYAKEIYWNMYSLSNSYPDRNPNVTRKGSGWSSSINLPATTTTDNTICIGVVIQQGSTGIYSGGNWTEDAHYDTAKSIYLIHSDETTAGEKNPGGSFDGVSNVLGAWAAYR